MEINIIHIYGENNNPIFPKRPKKAERMVKLMSELLYRMNNSILRDLINYKNDLLALEDILKELDKELK